MIAVRSPPPISPPTNGYRCGLHDLRTIDDTPTLPP